MYESCIEYFSFKAMKNWKVFKYIVLDLFKHYNFDIECVYIRHYLKIFKNIFLNIRT
jgi:hypothetical protein